MIAPPPRTALARSAPPHGTTAADPVGPIEIPTDPAPAPVNDGTQAAVVAELAAALARAVAPADLALEAQREAFDQQTRIQAEMLRETNALRDLSMQQIKNEDDLLKKWIALI